MQGATPLLLRVFEERHFELQELLSFFYINNGKYNPE